MTYRCLACGSTHGAPIPEDDAHEHWTWRLLPYGRVGPFCSPLHASQFGLTPACVSSTNEPRFTLREVQSLQFVAWRHGIEPATATAILHNH